MPTSRRQRSNHGVLLSSPSPIRHGFARLCACARPLRCAASAASLAGLLGLFAHWGCTAAEVGSCLRHSDCGSDQVCTDGTCQTEVTSPPVEPDGDAQVTDGTATDTDADAEDGDATSEVAESEGGEASAEAAVPDAASEDPTAEAAVPDAASEDSSVEDATSEGVAEDAGSDGE